MKLIFTGTKLAEIKLAGAKDKIQKYGITDPYLKSFVYKYENLVDWNKIKTTDDLNNFIKDSLIPSLYEIIDPRSSETNNYMKDIDIDREFERNMDQPHVQRAYQLRRKDENLAKQELLKPINDNKKNTFFEWWEYITKENEYQKHPAFQYMMLKSVFDSSPANKKDDPFAQNALAISTVYGEIGSGNTQINLSKSYGKALAEAKMMESSSQKVNLNDGWIRIPSQTNDPKNFEHNVELLTTLSKPRGWCTGVTHARPYLSGGDFWLLIKDREARVAIRFDGDKIAEIQGNQNKRPFEYWQEIFQLIDEKGFDKENPHYMELQKAKEIDEGFNNDPNYINKFREMFDKNPGVFEMLTKERQLEPGLLELAKEHWQNRILANAGNSRWGSPLVIFDRAPDHIKPLLNKEVLEQIFLSCVNSAKSSLDNIKWITDVTSFFKIDDYASRFVEEIEPVVIEHPWASALVNPLIENNFSPEVLKAIKETASYNMVVDLQLVDHGTLNPEEILKNYMGEEGEDWNDSYLGKDNEELEEVRKEKQAEAQRVRSLGYRSSIAIELDPSFCDEQLIEYIERNTSGFWENYIQKDPMRRYEELEKHLYDNVERYDNRDDFQMSYDLYDSAWVNEVTQNPRRVYDLPSEVSERNLDGYNDIEYCRWYVDAWISEVNKDYTDIFEAEKFISDAIGIDEAITYFRAEMLNASHYPNIREAAKKDFDFLFEQDHLEYFLQKSDFFENNIDFCRELLDAKMNLSVKDAKEALEIIEELYDHIDIYTDEEVQNLQLKYSDGIRRVVEDGSEIIGKAPHLIKNEPYRYHDLDDLFKDDKTYIRSWESSPERWIQMLREHGSGIAVRAPNVIKYDPQFVEELRKIQNEENQKNPNFNLTSNWYNRYKQLKFAQNVNLIDSSEVKDIIEGFGTQRFTIGFKKRDGSFRIMNAQQGVQRPYKGEGGERNNEPRDYITLYDLQIASQIVQQSIKDVNVDEFNEKLLRQAYRRVNPHTIELIKGGGKIYVVRGSDYAIENGFDGEVE